MLQSWCRKQKNPMWPFSNLNKIFPCAHSQLQTCNSYELFLLPFYFMYFIPKAETGLETKLQTPVSFINLAASLQSELLLLFLTVYHLKAREYCFYCYCENKSREKNNLELPFSSQSNIMGKKNRGRMSDTQRFFFLSYLQELRLVLQVTEPEFYQWAALGSFERTAGVWTMNPGCLYIWATKAIAVFTRNRIINKTSCHRHLKNYSPLLFIFLSHCTIYL